MTNLLVHAEMISLVQTACQETSLCKQCHLNLPVSLGGVLSKIVLVATNQRTGIVNLQSHFCLGFDKDKNHDDMNEIIQSALSSKFTQNNDGKKSKRCKTCSTDINVCVKINNLHIIHSRLVVSESKACDLSRDGRFWSV